jgi:hypothetical protein
MLANIKFSKLIYLYILATIFVLVLLISFVSNDVSAQGVNIAQSLCAGANLDYNSINNSGACGSGQIEASTLQLNNFVTSIISLLSWAIGVVAVFMIIVGGFKYITSGGDSAGVTAAKNTILYAIIGLVIVALSQLIVRFILSRISTVGLS